MLAPLATKLAHRFPTSASKPFLSAVATGANAGSTLAPISNPGNVIVTLASGMPFQAFVRKMWLPWLVASVVNATCVVAVYANLLFGRSEHEENADTHADVSDLPTPRALEEQAAADRAGTADLSLRRVQSLPAPRGHSVLEHDSVARSRSEDLSGTPEQEASVSLQEASDSAVAEASDRLCQRWRRLALQHWRGMMAYSVWVGCTVFWYLGVEVGSVAMCGAIILIAAEWKESSEAIASSADWPVVVYIAGILITIPGFNATGVPGSFWKLLVDNELVSMVNPVGMLVLIAVITFSTNIVTNVPAVLLLASHVAQLAEAERGAGAAEEAWLFVAFTAALAGSLTVQGSITQVISYSQSGEEEGGSVSFLEHLRIGVPTTILTLGLGLPLLLSEL